MPTPTGPSFHGSAWLRRRGIGPPRGRDGEKVQTAVKCACAGGLAALEFSGVRPGLCCWEEREVRTDMERKRPHGLTVGELSARLAAVRPGLPVMARDPEGRLIAIRDGYPRHTATPGYYLQVMLFPAEYYLPVDVHPFTAGELRDKLRHADPDATVRVGTEAHGGKWLAVTGTELDEKEGYFVLEAERAPI
jgi:hypothetical protein